VTCSSQKGKKSARLLDPRGGKEKKREGRPVSEGATGIRLLLVGGGEKGGEKRNKNLQLKGKSKKRSCLRTASLPTCSKKEKKEFFASFFEGGGKERPLHWFLGKSFRNSAETISAEKKRRSRDTSQKRGRGGGGGRN